MCCSAPAPPLSPGEVRERIGGDLAYTTVVTILSRLHAKGLLSRYKDGRVHLYARSPTSRGSPPGGWPGFSMRRPTARRCLARFVSALSDRDEELLRKMLADPAGPTMPGAGRRRARRVAGRPCT